MFLDWANTTFDALSTSYDHWIGELKKDVNLLLPVVCRYVNTEGKEDFVIKHIHEEYTTPLYRIVSILASMLRCFSNREDTAIDIISDIMRAYNTLSLRILGKSGALKHSVYFHEVRKNEYEKLSKLLDKFDGGAFSESEAEFNKLEAEVVSEDGNPIESDGKTWTDIAEIYEKMLSIADGNPSFAKIYSLDIADCYGHLGYAFFMDGKVTDAEKYLILKIETLKNIEHYDVANHYPLVREIGISQISLGNYYTCFDRLEDAINVWTNALKLNIEFVCKYGHNVVDSTKTRAGFVGSMTPLLQSDVVNSILQKIADVLPLLLNMDGEKSAAIFERTFETVKEISSLMPSPVFTLIPFLFHEILRHIPRTESELDIFKAKYAELKATQKELLELIGKYEAEVDGRKNAENPADINALFPLDMSESTMSNYAYIKDFAERNLAGFFDE